MKHFLFALLSCLPLCLFAQHQDSIAAAREVDSLMQASHKIFSKEKIEEALHLLEQAKAETDPGNLSECYAKYLHNRATKYIGQGKFNDAEPFCRMAKEIRERVLGRENRDYSLSLSYLATLYYELGRYNQAEPLAQQSKAVRAKIFGIGSREYGITLHLLGTLYYKLGQYDQSELYFLGAKDIFAITPGMQSPEYVKAVGNLASLYSDWGKYDQVEKRYLEAKAKQEISPGKGSSDYAATVNNLAWFYFRTGQYIKAKQFFIEANTLSEKLFGADSEHHASSLSSLASFYYEVGQYGQAELLFLQAKAILEKTVGKENHTYTATMTNLGALYFGVGRDKQAAAIFQELKQILEKSPGKNHPDYATAITNLANLVYQIGKDTAAQRLYEEAKNIREKILGNDHPDYAASSNNLAELYLNSGQYAKANSLFLEAKDICARKLGLGHQLYAKILKNLAQLYTLKGDFGKADSLFLEAKGIFAATLGNDHPSYATTLKGLTRLYQSTNRSAESAPFNLEQNGIIRRLIEKSAAYFSEKEMLAYLQIYEEDLAHFYSFAQINPSRAFIGGSFDNALLYNGYLLENARILERSVAGADSLTRDTFDRWQGCKRRLASEYTKPIAERRYVAETEAEAEGYEKTLTRKLSVFDQVRQMPHWQAVCDHLHKGEAAVEFIHYRYYNPEATDTTMYAALVLLPGDTCPHFVPLCEQRPLDSLLRLEYPDKRYERTLPSHSLYSLIWQPIEPLLQGISTVYYAPSGAFHSVNFDAIMLSLGGDSTLIDRYELVRLGSTRQLVAPLKADIAGNDALLFGGIRYESDSTAIQIQNKKNGVVMRGSSMDGLLEPGDSLQQINPLTPLPNTLKEAEYVQLLMGQKKFKTQMLTGFSASEEAFKHFADSMSASGTSARVLHLATHGYFFPDPKRSEPLGDQGFSDEPVFRISEHPYLRSGLVLAGGDHAWQTGKPFKAGMEDGILTAYEISAMSLPNTELVVLSACETGLGDLSGNEGVYGLQRAFKIAGARYLIMSLWKVPDEATKDLMSAFYRNWLDQKMDIPAAFRSAQLAMKKKNKDPETWAGFILLQ